MPSSSKAQQKFMGIVHGIQKGTIDPSSVSGAAKRAAKSMKKKSAKDYASTKHKGLPKKVKEEGFGGDLKGEDKKKFERARKANGEQLGYKLSGTSDVKEDRDYKEEYKKYGSSTKAKKYRAELNQYNRKKGTYGNGDGKDASHKGGKIVGFESQSKNRGRAEKSRLKKESSSAYGKSIEKMANDRKLKSISKKDRGLLLKIAKLMKKANEAKTVSIGGKELMKYLMKRFKMSKSQAIASMKKHKMDMSFLKKESVNEDGHTDVASIERKLKLIIQDSVDTIKKLRSMSNEDSLPSWWTDKITLAKDYVSKSRDFIMNPTESVNESIQLPHGMELGKVFTGHGKSFVKEAVEPAGNMRKIQHIVKSKTAMKVGGTIIDMQSASLLMKLYDKVSDKDKERMNKFPAKKLTLVIKRLWDRVNLKLPL